ncbi:MAG: GGDEF domain-containing protein [Gammaproteobacteria bacterium]|nr:GGDEF domain-containing protein [Gammaproteobacteria bacterium]
MQTQTSTLEMIKELKEVKGSFNAQERIDIGKISSAEAQQQIMLDLSVRLQMSLDIEWVINQFMEHIHSYLLFDGFSYLIDEPVVQIGLGRQQGHSCTYNLSIENDELGELVLYRGRKFAESELVLLENILCSLVYPLRNCIQFRQATLSAHRDSLTGVNNRSTFDSALRREVNLSQRHQHDFSILVIDIDYFKKVNDSYGHSAGDEVLKNVASIIQDNIRETDMLFRYGGEEFVVLLSNSDCEASYVIADRILESVSETSIAYEDQQLSVSVSIGLACLNIADTGSSLFNRADNALYTAKDAGRNQIKVA